ncbi:MAG: SDR family NAD(P)-dependent oxidoreductase [Spirochaetes bacterium]|nr:SDR family NAD(P)-dependent oxidoreductase [Spirochaetota bacterium]
MRMQNKTAIVTGGAQGIGKAYSIGLAREGANVVIADLDEAKGRLLEESIRTSGGRALFVRTDVSKKEDTIALVQKAVDAFGAMGSPSVR